VPDQPKTKATPFRIHDALKIPAAAKARSEGRDLAEVVRTLLAQYADLPPEAANLDWQPTPPETERTP
jgi:hypothetical protein